MAMTALAFYLEPNKSTSAWATIGPSLSFFQNLALLECAHSILGMVASPWHSTLLQIASRVMVVALYNWLPELANFDGLYILCFCWGITEVVRYTWYLLNIYSLNPKPF